LLKSAMLWTRRRAMSTARTTPAMQVSTESARIMKACPSVSCAAAANPTKFMAAAAATNSSEIRSFKPERFVTRPYTPTARSVRDRMTKSVHPRLLSERTTATPIAVTRSTMA